MDVENPPKYKKVITESPTPGSHTGSAAADSATAAAESDADADFAAAAVSATAADLATAAEPAASRGSKRTFSDLAPDQPDPTVTWAAPLPDQTRRQRNRARAASSRRKRDWHIANGRQPATSMNTSAIANGSVTPADITVVGDSAAVSLAIAADSADAPGPVVTSTASARNSGGVVRGSALSIAADSADAPGPVVTSTASARNSGGGPALGLVPTCRRTGS